MVGKYPFSDQVEIINKRLEFKNQRVEAAYRKELVYGEDHADRAQPPTIAPSSSHALTY